MRITVLLEDQATISARSLRASTMANALVDRGHDVLVLAGGDTRAGWLEARARTQSVRSWSQPEIPTDRICIPTSPVTLDASRRSRTETILPLCDGAAMASAIALAGEAVHGVLSISRDVTRQIEERMRHVAVHEIGVGVDHEVMFAGKPRPAGARVRVAVVGSSQDSTRDLQTGIRACELARAAGLDLEIVRISPDGYPDPHETDCPTEWHERLPHSGVGEVLRTVDAFVGTARGSDCGPSQIALEALACGVPAVLADTPNHRGFGARQYALFVDAGNASQFAEALVIVVGHPHVTEDLRRTGLETTAAFSENEVADRLERVLVAFPQPAAAPPGEPSAGAPPSSPLLRSPLHRAPLPNPALPNSPGANPAPPNSPQAIDATADGVAAPSELDELRTKIVDTLRHAAELEHHHGQWGRAAETFAAALVLSPDDPQLLHRHGDSAYLAGHDREALASYDRLVELGGDTPELHHNRGLVLYTMGDLRAAAHSLEIALERAEITPESRTPAATVHNDLGVVRYRLGDPAGARSAFEAALAADASLDDARRNLQDLDTSTTGKADA